MESFPCDDLSSMSDEEIDEYAAQKVLESGDPNGDPEPLAQALKNAPAIAAAMEDPFWADLVSIENYKEAGMVYHPDNPSEPTYIEGE